MILAGDHSVLWTAHGECFDWNRPVLIMRLIGDGVLALSYFGIPILILMYVRQVKTKMPLAVNMLALFISAGALTHVMDIVTLWLPWYGGDALVRLYAAAVAFATFAGLLSAWPELKGKKP